MTPIATPRFRAPGARGYRLCVGRALWLQAADSAERGAATEMGFQKFEAMQLALANKLPSSINKKRRCHSCNIKSSFGRMAAACL